MCPVILPGTVLLFVFEVIKYNKNLMKGQEITFCDNILFIYDLFPETEFLSDSSILDLEFIPGCMPIVMSCLA